MESVTLGGGGPRISRVGFGCAGIAGHDYGPVDRDQAAAALRAALDTGVTFVDVANVYGLGRAETIVGETIAAEEGVTVATKVGLCWDEGRRTWRDIRPEVIERSIEESLRRLRRDVLDVVQIHWPDGKTPVADAVAALVRCRERGKLRHIGVCNFTSCEVEKAAGVTQLVSLQMPANLLQRGAFELLRRTHAACGATPLCYNVLGQGLLAGGYNRSSRFEGTDVRQRSALFQEPTLSMAMALLDAMRPIALARGVAVSQVAIRWLLDTLPGACAIVGIKSAVQARENGNLISPLHPEERAEVDAVGVPA